MGIFTHLDLNPLRIRTANLLNPSGMALSLHLLKIEEENK